MVTNWAEVSQWKGGSESSKFLFVDFTHVSRVCVGKNWICKAYVNSIFFFFFLNNAASVSYAKRYRNL